MKLSIIVPAFNTEKYIKECLDSIFKELDETVEIILVDDGSTDSTEEIYSTYNCRNFRTFKNLNHGVSYSRNFGINKARGEWILFVDSDDKMVDGWKTIVLRELTDERDIVYFFGQNTTQDVNKLSKSNLIKEILTGGETINLKSLGSPWSRAFRREVVINNNIKFKEDVVNGEDTLFNIEALNATDSFFFVHGLIYQYRNNAFSSTHTYNRKLIESDVKFHSYVADILSKTDLTSAEQEQLKNYCLGNAIYTIMENLSYIDNFSEVKPYLAFLVIEPYTSYTKVHVTNRKGLIILLLQSGYSRLVYLYFRIKKSLLKAGKMKLIGI